MNVRTLHRLVRAALGAAYLTCVVLMVSENPRFEAAVLLLPVILILFADRARIVLRYLAFAHAALGVSLFHAILRRYGSTDPLDYAALQIFLPLAVALFVVEDERPAKVEGLPPGYEHLQRHRFYLTTGRKLAILLAAAVLTPVLMGLNMALLFVAMFAVPVWFGLHTIFSVLRSRRSEPGTAARRVVLRSRRPGPAQTKSYWTVNADPFRSESDDDR